MSRTPGDTLIPYGPTDVVHDPNYLFWGDSMYFWDYMWDVLERDKDHMMLKLRDSQRIWRMTRTHHPVAAKALPLPEGVMLP
jgi:hypothetical protein